MGARGRHESHSAARGVRVARSLSRHGRAVERRPWKVLNEAARPLEAPSSKDLINFTADLNECFHKAQDCHQRARVSASHV